MRYPQDNREPKARNTLVRHNCGNGYRYHIYIYIFGVRSKGAKLYFFLNFFLAQLVLKKNSVLSTDNLSHV